MPVLLAFTLALLPTTAIFGPDPVGADADRAAWIFSSDLPFLALAVVAWWTASRQRWVLALAAVAAVALAVHPTLRGGFVVLRVLALAVLIAVAVRHARLVTIGLVAATTLQVVVALAQKVAGGAVGLELFGELDEPYEVIGGALAPQGTTAHTYVFATLGLVTAAWVVRERSSWAPPALAVSLIPVGLAISRAALLGALAMLAFATLERVGWRKVAAGAAGLLLAMAVQWDGWVGRAEQVTNATTEAEVTTERGGLISDSITIIRRHPIAGVGPGQYVDAVYEHGTPGRQAKPVHNVPLLVTAELGIVGGIVFLLWLCRVGVRAGNAVPFLAVAPMLLLDHLLWWFPQGLLLLGLWMASLSSERAPASDR